MPARHLLKRIAPFGAALAAAAALVAAALVAVGLVLLLPAASAGAANAPPPITVPFDHLSTGFELDGVHRDLPCESCHLNAVFKGTPRNCGVCHINGSTFNATPKTQTHILSTNNCAACHNTTAFRPAEHFTHAEVMGSCVSCHNGTIAEGKGTAHPATSDNCASCHTTMSWNPPTSVDHTQIPLATQGFCIICHNGTSATGKNPGHLVTTLECGDCHLTTTWLGANFDHTGVVTNCYSCHNGVKAVGKQGNHMPTSNVCEACHTTGIGTKTPNWVPSAFDHTQMAAQNTCLPCHSGNIHLVGGGSVVGKPATHVPLNSSTADCIVCHGNTPAKETWDVLAASIPVLHTGLTVNNCLQCHAGQTFAGVPAPYIPMSISGISPTKSTPLAPPHIPVLAGTDCSSCHGAAYQTGGFGPATAMTAAKHNFVSSSCDVCHDTGKSFYVGSGTPLQLRPADHITSADPRMVSGDCSVCHTPADWTSNALPAGHMPNPSNLACKTCHLGTPIDYTPTGLAANSLLHTGIKTNCGQCHGNNFTALTWFNNFTPKDAILTPSHIPFLAGTDCSSCHASTTYAVGGFGPMNMTQATHSFAPSSCNTCHEAGLSLYMGAANPGLQGRPTDHNSGLMAAPNDCSGCHTTANWSSNVLPQGHMPNPGNLACATCHIAIGATQASYATLATVAVLHTGVTGNCGACHGATTALTWFNSFTPKDAILSPAHIPFTPNTDCSNCHAPNYVTGGFGPTNMTAAKHAFVPGTCDLCHEANLTFYLGASTPALQGRPPDHISSTDPKQQTGDCSGCHTPAGWTSNVLPVGHMPNPANQACATCHTAISGTFASYATLAPVATLHTGITAATGCAQCHGLTQLSFYNGTDDPKSAVLAPAHIPYTAGTDCGSCHALTYAAGGFGPTGMNPAKHAFVSGACDTCHEAGVSFYMGASTPALQGRPPDHIGSSDPKQQTADCSSCHNTTDWTSNVMPAGHMPNPAGQVCSVCHTAITGTFASYATLAGISVLHTGITAATGCAQCHGSPTAGQLTFYNGTDNPKAAVLTPVHIPYSNGVDCSNCHTTNYVAGGFGPISMSAAKHAFVPTTCDTCHEFGRSFYMGASPQTLQVRPSDHINSTTYPQQVTGDCSGCHETTDWIAAVLPPNHMPNPAGQKCIVCHLSAPTTYKTNFATNAVIHTGITSSCAQCHGATQLSFANNDVVVKAAVLSPPHIPAFNGEDCSSCHKSTTFASGGFGPMNMTQATHSGVGTTCNGCHEAGLSFYMGAASPGLQGRPADHTPTNMAAPNDCNGCHTTANWNSTTLPAGHMPNPAGQACNVCHTGATATPANFTTFASVAVLHTGMTAATGCAQCHGLTQLTFYNNTDNPKSAVLSPAHIAFNAGTDCHSCHTATFAAGGFGPMNMTQATHSFVAGAGSCVSCHEAGKSFYMGAANPALQTRPVDHTATNMAAPNDCANSGCHTTANWNSGTLPAGHMPNPASQGCAVCHTAIGNTTASYATLASVAVLHTGITTAMGCAQCHGYTQLTFYNNNDNPKAAVLTPTHIPVLTGTDCASCHTSNYVAGGFGPMNMTQTTHTYVVGTCVTCHEAGKSFYMGAANPGLQTRPADHTATNQLAPNDCSNSGCHTTANWNSGTLPAGHMPNPGNQTCATCHTAINGTTGSYATLASISVLHTGITNNCIQCHGLTQLTFYNNNDNPKSAVLTPAHIAFLSGTDCGACHTSNFAAGGFGPMNMSQATHAYVAGAGSCVSCHEAGKSFYMGAANPALQTRPPADHLAGTSMGAPNDCANSGCHTTKDWSSGTFPAGHMPNPGNQACSHCHTAIGSTTASYATLASNTLLHTGITTSCITCHAAVTQTPPVFYLNYTPKSGYGLAPPHIPSATTACEACHSKTQFTAFTGVQMNGTMHNSMFAVTGLSTCDQCHNNATPALAFAGVTNLDIRPNDHITSKSAQKQTGDCNGCHSPQNGWDNAQVRAAAKTATKATVTAVATVNATPKTVPAPGSTLPRTRAPGVVVPGTARAAMVGTAAGPTHAGVTANCSTCHNGSLASGKPATHIASNNTCENCHTTLGWLPARFDHRGTTAACSSCHNGVQAPGKPASHLRTTQECSICHSAIAWAPATFDHTGLSATCQSCHNAMTAIGKPAQHVATIQDCSTCHNTLTWTVATPPKKLRPLLITPHSVPGPTK